MDKRFVPEGGGDLPERVQYYADWLERLVIGFPSEETAEELVHIDYHDFVRLFGLCLGILQRDYYPTVRGVD